MTIGFGGLLSKSDRPNIDREGLRFQLESGIGYRFYLGGDTVPFYLAPSAGIVARIDYEMYTAVCADETVGCARNLAADKTSASIVPTAGISFHIGPGQLSSKVQLEPFSIAKNIHQVGLGIWF